MMSDEPGRLEENSLERLFPWLRLFRALGASIDAKKLILAVFGLLVFEAGREGIARLFPRPEPVAVRPWVGPFRASDSQRLLEPPGPAFPADRASIAADVASAPW